MLGTFPLVITAIEAYMNFLADWGKTTSELRSMHRRLSTEQSKLYNLCDRLLSDIVPQKDIEPMLKDPFSPLWQDLNTNDRIRRRLWASYGPFRATISEVQETMTTVEARLKIHISDDGHVTWVQKKGMSQEFKKFLFRLNRKDFQDSMNVISRAVGNLESLTQVSIGLESKRQIARAGRLSTFSATSRRVYTGHLNRVSRVATTHMTSTSGFVQRLSIPATRDKRKPL